MRPDPARIAKAHTRKQRLGASADGQKTASMSRTAGEVRFIKDRGGDKNEWGWGSPGPSERQITSDFVFDPKYLKPLATTMRSALMALGHVSSAHDRFLKIKSRDVSPDGSLGGKGYIQKVSEMRRQLMNCSEALSAFTDTIYDEMAAPHWDPAEDTLDPRERDEVREIVEEAEEIREDPTGWADEEEEDEFGKTAGTLSYRGDTPLDKAYAMTDLLIELGKDLPTGSSRSREFKAVKTALRSLEGFVKGIGSDTPRPRAAQTVRRKTAAWAGIDYMRGDDRWTLGKAVESRRVRVPSGYELVSEPGKVVLFNWGVLDEGATAEFRFMPDGTNIQFIIDGYNDKRSPGLVRHRWVGNPVDDAVLIEKHIKKYMPALVKAVSDDEEDLLREIERRQRMAGIPGSTARVLARFMEVNGE